MKTSRNVTGFTYSARYLHQHITCFDLVSLVLYDVGSKRQGVGTQDIVVFIHNSADGALVLSRDSIITFSSNRLFIRLNLIGDIFGETFEPDLSGRFGNDDCIERIPFADQVTFRHFVTLVEIEFRTVGDVVGQQHDFGVEVYNTHFHQSANHHFVRLAFGISGLYVTEFVELEGTVVLGYDTVFCSDVRSDTSHVERTQRKLCSGSPMDWAAITPTASPLCTILPVARFLP